MSEDMKCIHYWTVTSECPKCLRAEVNRLTDELDATRTEMKRLREALRDIERGDYSDPMCVRTPEQRAREALEGKP